MTWAAFFIFFVKCSWKRTLPFHRKGCRSPTHLFPAGSATYIIRPCQAVHGGNLKAAASWGNALPDLWVWRASLLLLALRVVHEGVGSEVTAKVPDWQREWGCDGCGNAEGSSPTLSITAERGMQCNVRLPDASTHVTPLHTFSFSEVSTSVLTEASPAPLRHTHKHTPSPWSVHQSSRLPLTLINSDSQNSPLSLSFLSLHPSILLNLHTHFLSIYLPRSSHVLGAPRQSCRVNGWHWRDYCISISLFLDGGEQLSRWLN